MLTLTKHRGIGGIIKQVPDDFVVKEITDKGFVLEPDRAYDAQSLGLEESKEGKHITFVLQKSDWNTVGALIVISKKLGHGRKSIGYAGAKDKKALTVQLASVYHPQEYNMNEISVKDIQINGFWRSSEEVKLGTDLGNAFKVNIKETTNPDAVEKIAEELHGRIPNYFGVQRFGERMNNAKVGLSILKGNFEEGVLEYLTGTENERNEKVVGARKGLKESMDFKEALNSFPKFLKGERTVLTYLVKHSANYANAIRLLPRGIAMMFIHAVQSQIFNEELELRIKNNDFNSAINAQKDFYGFPDMSKIEAKGEFPLAPLIGYETKEEEISENAKEIMSMMQITKESFQLKSIRELGMKGSHRPLLSPVKDLSYKINDRDVALSFSLPKGAYATVLLDEFKGR